MTLNTSYLAVINSTQGNLEVLHHQSNSNEAEVCSFCFKYKYKLDVHMKRPTYLHCMCMIYHAVCAFRNDIHWDKRH